MTKPPLVSVIIPAFNRGEMLRRALHSVRAQTCQDYEVFVVDDCSRDELRPIVATFDDARLHYLRHQTNRGGSAARNTGIAAATGEFVAFLDSDDEWDPEKLARQVDLFRNGDKNLGLVYTRVRTVPPEETRVPHLRGRVFDALLENNFVGGCSCVTIPRAVLIASGGFDESLQSCQDWDAWLAVAKTYDIDFLIEPLTTYHWADESITRDPTRSLSGHRRFAEKWNDAINALPAKRRVRLAIHMGKVFWWRGKRKEGIDWYLRAAKDNPTALFSLMWLIGRGMMKKILLLKKLR